ncbi:MAG: A/G-specific adenine glycosylase [bacterium]|nr:A/G-specific adenine glycosylase [bacterium]
MIARPIAGYRTIADRQRALMRWYQKHGRHHLPWRHEISPYRVLVSEMMLQQTQVDRVIPYFETWMRRWPTIEVFARARRGSVLRMWAGLGYNRRAVHLHGAAQRIVREGWFHDVDMRRGVLEGRAGSQDAIALLAGALQRLPGIGSYTAHAVLTFAWNLPAPCVDVNVRRVLAYVIYRRPAIMRLPLADVERLAARVIPRGKGCAWNSALMDYGALVFRASDVPQRSRPKPTQGTFINSTRFWRGRIVAVLRGDSSMPARRSHIQWTVRALQQALTRYGTPPDVTPLLIALTRDGVIVRRGTRYVLG